jgi:hypothetical protein
MQDEIARKKIYIEPFGRGRPEIGRSTVYMVCPARKIDLEGLLS